MISHRTFWILVISVGLTAIIFKKRLSELKGISYLFLGMMISFVLLMCAEMYTRGGNIEITYAEATTIKFDHRLITAISIIIFTYNIQFLVFSAYHELSHRSTSRFAKASMLSIFIETVFYISIAFMGILLLGPQEIKEDFMKNLAQRAGAVSVAMRFLFCMLVILDMPFMYMATREQGLVIHDELVNYSISRRTQQIMQE